VARLDTIMNEPTAARPTAATGPAIPGATGPNTHDRNDDDDDERDERDAHGDGRSASGAASSVSCSSGAEIFARWSVAATILLAGLVVRRRWHEDRDADEAARRPASSDGRALSAAKIAVRRHDTMPK